MTMNEARTEIIKELTERFEEEAEFPKNIAKQAATDMIDNAWTYERTRRKYRKKLMSQNEPETV